MGLHAAGRLQAQQTTADHRDALLAAGIAHHRHGVVQRAKAEDSRCQRRVIRPQAFYRREEGAAAGGQHQLVVPDGRPIIGVDPVGEPVNADYPHPGMQPNAVVAIPVPGVEEKVRIELVLVRVDALLWACGEQLREQDAVVVAVRLVTEHGDTEHRTATAGQDLFDSPSAPHTISDHHQFFHGIHTSTRPKSTTTSPTQPSGAAT